MADTKNQINCILHYFSASALLSFYFFLVFYFFLLVEAEFMHRTVHLPSTINHEVSSLNAEMSPLGRSQSQLSALQG